jgi:hypothetical protein
MTKTDWKRRNKRTALDLAKAGVSIERIIDAQREMSEKRGEIVWSLHFVQEHLAKGVKPENGRSRPDLRVVDQAFIDNRDGGAERRARREAALHAAHEA